MSKTVESTKQKNKYFCSKCKDKNYLVECKCGCKNQSWSYDDPILEFAMANVRVRDKNTCQWHDCGKQTTIQVHHIFPQAEYPELKYIEKYMICYCRYHHREWHKKRGDLYYCLIRV